MVLKQVFPAVALTTLLAGCQTGLVCAQGTVEAGGQCYAVTDTGTDSAGIPTIISFASNVTTLAQGDSVTFTAMVTHPDGIDKLIGGTLMSGSGATYGAFATSADEGAYTTTISWWQINQINPINLSENTDGSRPFVATFFDVDGEFAESELQLGLTCDDAASCDGVCGRACDDADTGR